MRCFLPAYCWGTWQSLTFSPMTTMPMEIFTLKSLATFLSAMFIRKIPVPRLSRPWFACPVIRFLLAIYPLGHGDDETLRLAQGVLNTLTCVLIALLAYMWEPRQRHQAKRHSSCLPSGRRMSVHCNLLGSSVD